MKTKLSLQTQSAFERIHEAILGKTDDDLKHIIVELQKHLKHCMEVDVVLEEMNHDIN